MAAYTTIDDPTAYFQAELYTGTGSALSTTFDSDTDMSPNVVWIKNRSGSEIAHNLTNSVSGTGKYIRVDEQDAEVTDANSVTAFGSDGFTTGTSHSVSSNTYVAWCWKESATAGFDIVNHTGTGSNTTVSHALSAVPHFIFPKNRDTAEDIFGYHHKMASDPETDYININTTGVPTDNATMWQDTAPTSSVISVGTANALNKADDNIIYFIWTGIQGFSQIGSYVGNGNADGPFVYLGFRPAFLMTKRIDSTNGWRIRDNKRDPLNPAQTRLYANTNDSEQANDNDIDFLSNGFKLYETGAGENASSGKYIYVAFAESPFANSNGVPNNAR
jgi:hypothetical protein